MEEDNKRRKLDPALQELKAAQDAKIPIVRLLASPDSYPFEEKVLRVTESLTIGRSNLTDIKNGLFECPQLSATHATINYKDGSFTIFDRKSKNGSYLNDDKFDATPVQIFCGDKLHTSVYDERQLNYWGRVQMITMNTSPKNQCRKAQFLKAHFHALSQFFRGW